MRRATRIFFAALRMAIALAVLAYLGASGAINWSALRGLAALWPWTLAALAMLFVATIAAAWRLCVLMRPRGLHLTLASSVRLTLIGMFFNTCLPGATGGDVVKIYYASAGNRGRGMELATVILLDRAAGMFAMVLWPLLAAPFFTLMDTSRTALRGLLWTAAAIAAAMIACLLAGTAKRVRHSRLVAWAFRTLPLGHYAERVFETIHLYRHNAGALLSAVAISLLIHTLTIGTALLVARATNPDGFSWMMSLLVPLAFLVNTLPLTPGGLGVGEAASGKLFALAGLRGGAEMFLGWRLLLFVVTLAGLVFYLQGRRQFVHASQLPSNVKEEFSFS